MMNRTDSHCNTYPKSTVGARKRLCLIAALAVLSTAVLGSCSSEQQSSESTDNSSTDVLKQSSNNSNDTDVPDEPSQSGAAQIVDQEQAIQAIADIEAQKSSSFEAANQIELLGSEAKFSCDGVSASGSEITISKGGAYCVSGSYSGCITVDAKGEDVEVILNGADISNTGAAVNIKKANSIKLTLAEGSINKLSSSFDENSEDSVDGAVFSKDDLTVSGTGKLAVSSQDGHGIVSKDSLTIESGEIISYSTGHFCTAKDTLDVKGGSFTVSGCKDAFHAEDKDDSTKGYITVSGGSFTLYTVGDGFDSANDLTVSGGSFYVCCGGGHEKASENTEESCKGFKASGNLYLGGDSDSTLDITVDSADDSFHSGGELTVKQGAFTVSSGDDAFHSDDVLSIGVQGDENSESTGLSGPDIRIDDSYEGLEGSVINIYSGSVYINSDDDGINAGGGADSSGFGGFRGDAGSPYSSTTSESILNIYGGSITVNAEGDGLDSNGPVTISGGYTIVYGPLGRDNGALDYDGKASITGGTVIALDNGGMSMNFSEASQGSVLLTVQSQTAGTELSITDSSGNEIISCTPEKNYSAVTVSSPLLKLNESYTVTAGSFTTEITLSNYLYGESGMMGGGFGGGMGHGGRPGGNNGGNMELPPSDFPGRPQNN